MKTFVFLMGMAFFFAFSPINASDTLSDRKVGSGEEVSKGKILITIATSLGEITVELAQEKAPLTVENFLRYSGEGFFDNLIFHRVIDGFMVQGGGFNAMMQPKKPFYSPIKNESSNGLKNKRGTIAKARTQDPHSATSQFFINLVDNPSLDYSKRNEGYAVFGHVVEGMEVVDKIAKTPTKVKGPFSDVPRETVLIKTVKILD